MSSASLPTARCCRDYRTEAAHLYAALDPERRAWLCAQVDGLAEVQGGGAAVR
jgi:hypothetical protein